MKLFNSVSRLASGLLFMLLIMLVSGCEKRNPIKVGFVAGLSGRFSDNGSAARDGALLAVKEINRQGGVKGRQVKLIFKNDRQDIEILRAGLNELDAEGVRLVIGPLTSQMAMAAVEATNGSRLVFVSPTVSTPLLSGQDDNFFRIYPKSDQLIDRLAQYVINLSLQNVCILADTTNAAFTLPSMERFESTFSILGGNISLSQTFQLYAEPGINVVTKKVIENSCDGVVAFASAADLAMISQQLAKLDLQLPMFTTEWAYSRDLIELGGRSVDGVTLVHTYNQNDQTSKGKSFVRRFKDEFGYSPNFSALHSFDATKLALFALKSATDGNLSQALIDVNNFSGVQSDIKFDEYGDVIRDIFLSQIVDGRFVQKQRL